MANIDIIRAWKDADYRNSLSEDQRSQLPKNPAGMIELSDAALETISGGIVTVGTGTGMGTGRNCTKCAGGCQ